MWTCFIFSIFFTIFLGICLFTSYRCRLAVHAFELSLRLPPLFIVLYIISDIY